MTEKKPIEQRIADFLVREGITIIPGSKKGRISDRVLSFVQCRRSGENVDLGKVPYNRRSGIATLLLDEVDKMYQVEGFIENVYQPTLKLLRSTRGNFNGDERWDPIRDACDQVKSQYGGF